MKPLIQLLLIIVVPFSAWAQTEVSYDSLSDIHHYIFRAQQYDYNSNNQQNSYHTVAIKGSAMLFNTWQPGTIPYVGNRTLYYPLNYNIVEDYVIINLPEETLQIFPESFTISNRKFIRLNNQYYEALYLGRTKLLRRYTARLDKVERNGYNENIKYDYEYSKGEDLFLESRDGTLSPVRLSEKSLLSKLSDPQNARAIVRAQKLNLRSEKDVITLLAELEQ
jgi:hypothetical protein